MAKLRSQTVLSRYKSIRRPRGGTSSGGSAFSTIARRQQAAEDAIIDNQYETGQIDATYYQSVLRGRAVRPTLTPLQLVNLEEKIKDVAVKVQDATVKTQFETGQIGTKEYLAYQQQKLSSIPQSNSLAYQQQAAVVQNLTDKLEKEERSAYRSQRLNELSQMPDDNSETLWQKAEMYQELAQQAEMDGDTQTALNLQTQYNLTVNSAKRADINDRITNIRLENSQFEPAGLGVPTAEAGRALLGGGGLPTGTNSTSSGVAAGAGGKPVNTVGGGSNSIPSGSTGSSAFNYSSFGTSGGSTSAYKALDRIQKSYDRTSQSIAKQYNYVNELGAILNDPSVSGDQRTALEIQYNNARNAIAGSENQLALLEESFNNQVEKVYAAQAAAAKSAFKKQKSAALKELKLEENALENKLKKGQFQKEDYLAEATEFVLRKTQTLQDIANAHRQFGEDDTADQIEQVDLVNLGGSVIGKLGTTLANATSEQDVVNAIREFGGGFELVRVDKNGTLDSVTGATKNRGDVTLMDVAELKESGQFENQYLKDGNVFSKIYYSGSIDPFTGLPKGATSLKEMVQLGKGKAPYFYGEGGKKQEAGLIEWKNANGEVKQILKPQAFIKKNSKYYRPEKVAADDGTEADSGVLFTINEAAKVKNPNLFGFSLDFDKNSFANPFTNENTIGGQVVKGVKNLFGVKPAQDKKIVTPKVELPVQAALKKKEPVKAAPGLVVSSNVKAQPNPVKPVATVQPKPAVVSAGQYKPVTASPSGGGVTPTSSYRPPVQQNAAPGLVINTRQPVAAPKQSQPAPNPVQNVINNVAKAAQPVTNAIGGVVKNVSNWFKGLFK